MAGTASKSMPSFSAAKICFFKSLRYVFSGGDMVDECLWNVGGLLVGEHFEDGPTQLICPKAMLSMIASGEPDLDARTFLLSYPASTSSPLMANVCCGMRRSVF